MFMAGLIVNVLLSLVIETTSDSSKQEEKLSWEICRTPEQFVSVEFTVIEDGFIVLEKVTETEVSTATFSVLSAGSIELTEGGSDSLPVVSVSLLEVPVIDPFSSPPQEFKKTTISISDIIERITFLNISSMPFSRFMSKRMVAG